MIFIAGDNERLNCISNVRNHLHRAAEIITTPFFRDNVLVNAPSCDVIFLASLEHR